MSTSGSWLRSRWSAQGTLPRGLSGPLLHAGSIHEPRAMSLSPIRSRTSRRARADSEDSASEDEFIPCSAGTVEEDCVPISPSRLPLSSATGQACTRPTLAGAAFVFGHGPGENAALSCAATPPSRPPSSSAAGIAMPAASATARAPTAGGDGEAPAEASSQGTPAGQGRKRVAADMQGRRNKRPRAAAGGACASSTEAHECQEVVLVDSKGEAPKAGAVARSAETTELEVSAARC